ncbi:hypothetical protein UJ101_00924 [Flavobacteriaceae bacterium UJ101]|nr:hypothetical protein UJ101_00924 [Flavobacteriaceae bacterium UJ101]
MKNLFLAFSIMGIIGKAQVGIGTANPDAETLLDLKSEDQNMAMGLPVVELNSLIDNDLNPVKNPKEGFFVYNSNESLTESGINYGKGIFFHDGTKWNSVNYIRTTQLSEAKIENLRFGDPDGTFPYKFQDYIEVIDNIGDGGAFDEAAGTFTAPETSIYEVTLSTTILALSPAIFYVYVNDSVLASTIVTAAVNLQSPSTTTALDLKKGDVIRFEMLPLQPFELEDKNIIINEFRVQFNSQTL